MMAHACRWNTPTIRHVTTTMVSPTELLLRCLFLGTLASVSVGEVSAQQPAARLTARDGESLSGATLSVIDISPNGDGESYQGRFLLRNRGQRPVKVLGSRASSRGPLSAHYVRAEVLENDVWKSLGGPGDMIPLTVVVAPGEEARVVADLPFEENRGRPVTGRIRWSGLVSDRFVLDWEADRKAGRFALARTRHVEKLRSILISVGFRKERLQNEEFWEHFVRGLCDEVSATRGFRPFRCKTISLPRIDGDDEITCHVWSDDTSDHEYLYQLDIVVSPSKLSRTWSRWPHFGASQARIGQFEMQPGRQQIDFTVGEPHGAGFEVRLQCRPPMHDKPLDASHVNAASAAMVAELARWCP